MHLLGWVNPLPTYIVEAIKAGTITVHQGKGFEYLQGKVVNPNTNTTVSFK